MATTTWRVTPEPHGEVREGLKVERIERPVLRQSARHVQISIRLGGERPVRLSVREAMGLREALVAAIAGDEAVPSDIAEVWHQSQREPEAFDHDIPPRRKAPSAVVYASDNRLDRQTARAALERLDRPLTERAWRFVWRYLS